MFGGNYYARIRKVKNLLLDRVGDEQVKSYYVFDGHNKLYFWTTTLILVNRETGGVHRPVTEALLLLPTPLTPQDFTVGRCTFRRPPCTVLNCLMLHN